MFEKLRIKWILFIAALVGGITVAGTLATGSTTMASGHN